MNYKSKKLNALSLLLSLFLWADCSWADARRTERKIPREMRSFDNVLAFNCSAHFGGYEATSELKFMLHHSFKDASNYRLLQMPFPEPDVDTPPLQWFEDESLSVSDARDMDWLPNSPQGSQVRVVEYQGRSVNYRVDSLDRIPTGVDGIYEISRQILRDEFGSPLSVNKTGIVSYSMILAPFLSIAYKQDRYNRQSGFAYTAATLKKYEKRVAVWNDTLTGSLSLVTRDVARGPLNLQVVCKRNTRSFCFGKKYIDSTQCYLDDSNGKEMVYPWHWNRLPKIVY